MSDGQRSAQQPNEQPDRRESARFEVLGRVLGTIVAADLPVRVRDIGLGGFSIETVEPFDAGTEHNVRYPAMDDWSGVLPATSLHCRPSVAQDGTPRYVTGFAFPAANAREAIVDLIAKVTSVRLFDDKPES